MCTGLATTGDSTDFGVLSLDDDDDDDDDDAGVGGSGDLLRKLLFRSVRLSRRRCLFISRRLIFSALFSFMLRSRNPVKRPISSTKDFRS